MPFKCVVYGCSNTPDLQKCIAIHRIPYYGDSRPEAVKRRKRWIDFVKQKRAKWEPSKSSGVCSKHFTVDDFQRRLDLPNLTEPGFPRLKTDDLGVSSIPSVQMPVDENAHDDAQMSARTLRAIRRKVQLFIYILFIDILSHDDIFCR